VKSSNVLKQRRANNCNRTWVLLEIGKHAVYGIVMITIYVDDYLVIEKETGIDGMINDLRYFDFGLTSKTD
jgi:hypothetical protein